MKIRNLVFGAICGIIFFSCSESGGGKEVEMDRFVTDLMGKMTIREKLGQLNLPSGGDLVTGSVMNSELSDMIRKEEIGGFFNVKGIKKIYDLQRLAVEETRFSPYRWRSHAVGIRWLFSGWRGFLPLRPVQMAFAGHSARW